MQQKLNKEVLDKITYLVGTARTIEEAESVSARRPFDEEIVNFLNELSNSLIKNPESRAYSDVITFAFWIRKGSVLQQRKHFEKNDGNIYMGRGLAFHIAPSNVAINFAYSLVTGLLAGNSNIVRIPSKDFPQTNIIVESIKKALVLYKNIQPYIILVRYERNKEINDALSGIADVRIVWGGDATIAELRKSELPPRSTEITFSDRYSLAVIDSDVYWEIEDKKRVAEDFYNDTYLSDQNACTSPRIVIWLGKNEKAKMVFWEELHSLAKEKYVFQPIQGMNKLTSSYLMAAVEPGTKIKKHTDNLIIRVAIPKIEAQMMDLKDNSGYFFEYDCKDVLELKALVDDKRCQTIGILGDSSILEPLLTSGIKGVDRVVPLGKTMDFELIWDGYNLINQLTRIIRI